MYETIIAVCITALASIVTTIITSRNTSQNMQYRIDQLEKNLNALGDKVDQHNNFGIRLTAIETEISNIKEEVRKAG